jgi:chromosome partitioning protein
MEHVNISRGRLLELLALSESELAACEANGPLKQQADRPKVEYSLEELSSYRTTLQRRPPRKPLRKQLFLNFKGGTGKTSLSVSYAHRLAELGHRVLLLDLDSQGHATKCLGYEGESCETTLYDVLIKKAGIVEAKIETALSELHVVPANLRMATIDLALMPLANREGRLKKALAAIESDYEYIIMDAPPAFGLLNLNAIVAADDLFVPVLPDFLSFHGLKLLFETLDDIEEDLEHRLDRIFVVVNQYNPTTKIARAACDALRQHYADYLLPVTIRQCTKFAQASSEGMPIFAFDPTSKGAKDIQTLIDSTDVTSARATEELHA